MGTFVSLARVRAVGLTLICSALLPLHSPADVRLGRQTFGSVRTRPLTAAIGGASFYMRVGGVAFGDVATGDDGWVVADLRYDPSKVDGERLSATLSQTGAGTAVVSCPIPDWQLVPIARLAASDNHACVTLFGDENDVIEPAPTPLEAAALEEIIDGGRVVLYHEALQNEILGLRILQADMLLLSKDCAHLFTTEDGETILGQGETVPDVAANRRAFRAVKRWMQGEKEQFQSYVITGSPTHPVKFRPHEGLLLLSGEPYWDCWRWSDQRQDLMEQLFQVQMDLYFGDITEEEAQVKMAELEKQLGDPKDEDIAKMPEYSAALSDLIRQNNGINPAVYRSLQMTVRYGALLRHAKQHCGPAFARLVEALRNVQTSPLPPVQKVQVETPGLWRSED